MINKFDDFRNIFSYETAYFKLKVVFLFPFFILPACKMNDQPPSNDINALNRIIRIDANLKPAHWEVFTTPEYNGGVPGPTDYISLVIEVDNPPLSIIPNTYRSESIWIAPRSARPWMTKQNKLFFEPLQNKTIDISSHRNCRGISAWLAKTNKRIYGIACRNSSIGLIYFTLEDHTSQPYSSDSKYRD